MRSQSTDGTNPAITLNDRQAAFFRVAAVPVPWDPEGSKMIKLANGGFSSGKSTVCEWEHVEHCLSFPKGLSLIIRKSVKGRADLSCVPDIKKIVEPRGWAKYLSGDEMFRFTNGHESWVRPTEDWQSFGSVDITNFFAQEAHEIKDPNVLPILSARLRHPAGYRDGRPYFRGLMDARGVDSKHWLMSDFIAKAWNYDSGAKRRMEAENPNWVYMRFKTSDNAENNAPNYEELLRYEYRGNEARIRVFIDGEIGIAVEGRPVFAGAFDRDRNVGQVSEDPTLPILRGWDFGFRCPAVVFMQYTRSGRLLVLREFVPTNISIFDLIREVKAFQADAFPRRRDSAYRDYGDLGGDQINSSGLRDLMAVEDAFNTEVIGRKGDIKPGLDDMRRLMTDGVVVQGKNVSRFVADESCEYVISACMGSYYFEDSEKREDPVKGTSYAAVIDCIRYCAQQVIEESPLSEAEARGMGNVSFGTFGGLKWG